MPYGHEGKYKVPQGVPMHGGPSGKEAMRYGSNKRSGDMSTKPKKMPPVMVMIIRKMRKGRHASHNPGGGRSSGNYGGGY